MEHVLSFEIPQTPENEKAFEQLKQMSLDAPTTLYADYDDKGVKPICNIQRHPDCPKEIYEAFIKSILG